MFRNNTQFFFFSFAVLNAIIFYLFLLAYGGLAEMNIITKTAVVQISIFFTGVQVGQTALIQNNVSNVNIPSWMMYGFLAFLGMIFYFFDLDDIFLIVIIGVVCGYHFASSVIRFLIPSDKWKFQLFLFMKNLFFGVTIFSMAFLDQINFLVILFLNLIASALLEDNQFYKFSKNVSVRDLGVGLIAIALPLIYRNDVNLVRAAYSESIGFVHVNQAVIFYSIMVSISGFFVTNYIYTNFRAGSSEISELFPIRRMTLLYLIGVTVVFLSWMIFDGYRFFIACSLAATLTPYLSSYLHCKGRSWWVYLSGAGLFCMAACEYYIFDFDIRFVFSLYLIGLLSVLYLFFLILNKR